VTHFVRGVVDGLAGDSATAEMRKDAGKHGLDQPLADVLSRKKKEGHHGPSDAGLTGDEAKDGGTSREQPTRLARPASFPAELGIDDLRLIID
jgi:hypothetical protein